MANSAVPITAGSGTNIDTFTQSSGDHRQAVVVGDASGADTAQVSNSALQVSQVGVTDTTRTVVAASATAVSLVSSTDGTWAGVSIVNDSSAVLYLGFGSGPVAPTATNHTVAIQPGGYYETPYRWQGPITGIWSAASGSAYVTVWGV